METRIVLIVAGRGITEMQLAKYFVRRRKNRKPRFDYWRFAKDQGISRDLTPEDIKAARRRSTSTLHRSRSTR